MMIPLEVLEVIKKYLTNRALKTTALTGAGISKESGIPTFREDDGLWQKYNPSIYANLAGLMLRFLHGPQDVVNFATDFTEPILNARPNSAHMALATLEKDYNLSALITQNIDNLHQEAKSEQIIELHGNIYRAICQRCQSSFMISRKDLMNFIESLQKHSRSRIKLFRIYRELYPKCNCGGRFRPDIVFFGESLNQENIDRAYQVLSKSSLVFLVGTSSVVYPAASLPVYAKENGARIIEINLERSQLSDISDYNIFAKVTDAFTEILNYLKKGSA